MTVVLIRSNGQQFALVGLIAKEADQWLEGRVLVVHLAAFPFTDDARLLVMRLENDLNDHRVLPVPSVLD